MPEHKFCYPRVVPVPPKRPPHAAGDGRAPRSPRDLEAASPAHRPPRDDTARRPDKR